MQKEGGLLFARQHPIALLQIMMALLGGSAAQAGIVEDYNSKPILAGHDSDSRWQERARMPQDPEVVLGKDWRRSYWAFSPSFARQLDTRIKNRPPQPAYLSVENLSPGLEGIELRVSWNAEENLYRCSYHLLISHEVPVIPDTDGLGGLSAIPTLPPGIGLKHPPKWQGFDDRATVFSMQQMLSGLTILESVRRNVFGGMTYASLYDLTCGALAHSSADKKLELGVAIDPMQKSSGVTRKGRNRTFAVFDVPNSLVRNGSPYFRRANKINTCYFSERRLPEAVSREPAQFREQRERECKELRTLPIDSTEKPSDVR